ISGYEEFEIIGAPHSILRHPDMPRCVFKLLWDSIKNNEEIFAYVLNKSKNGDHYWVHAHVTPTVNRKNEIIGYHSNRRAPSRGAI
ncbi:MAG: PAS domain-containing protein, partial [Rhodoferax sp.]|nr:PAS domain-containing protein [Rhodoferax sp.]